MDREAAVAGTINDSVVRELLRMVREAASAPGDVPSRCRDVALDLYRVADRVTRTHPHVARRIKLTARQLAAPATTYPTPKAEHAAAPLDVHPASEDAFGSLPPRYARVLRHLLAGGSEKEIARDLGLSRHTIHEYVKAIYRHVGVGSRAQLATAAFTSELLSA
jgi:DNA-binding NarL/FixJ family response regulator